MATIPRTYLTTSKTGLADILPKNGQVISIWDSDAVYYDAPADGQRDGQPIRRKISGVRVVSELPANPMTDIVYVYIGEHGYIPDPEDPEHPKQLYDMRVWVNDAWLVVGSNVDDTTVRTMVTNDKFYIVGAPSIDDNTISALRKNSKVYIENGELYGALRGNADTATVANRALRADISTQAENDVDNQPLQNYVYGLSSDATTNLGSTITITKGDGTTSTIRVSDTTYTTYTASTAGLVPGTSTVMQQDTSNIVLTGDGWVAMSSITFPTAASAEKDGLGNIIAETYVASAAYDTSTDILTLTYGDTSTDTISIPNTEYAVFDVNNDGLVPQPSSSETSYFLRGDGTWQSVIQASDTFVGGDSGHTGLVPTSTDLELNGFLKGDATWGGVFDTSDNGLVPAASTTGDTLKFLKGDGTWDTPTDTQNTAGSEADTTHKLYLIGAQSQSNAGEGVATYSNVNAYIQSNKLFSNGLETVTISGSQAITGKTYEGYTLGSACAKSYASIVTASDDIPTNNAVISYITTAVPNLIGNLVEGKVDNGTMAPIFDSSVAYSVDDWCIYTDSGDQYLWRCKTPTTAGADFDSTQWDSYNVIDAIKYLIAHS